MNVQRQFDRRTFNGQEATPPFGGTGCEKLRDADAMLALGRRLGEALQALEISEVPLSRWRTHYGGTKSEEAKRVRLRQDG